jgi:replicative DNA helicase
MTVSRILRKTAVSVENGATKGKAGKWLDEYTEQLNGKNVYILWDNDETGKNFANLEARKLLGNVAHVYMIDLTEAWPECPEKGDVTDMEKAIGRKETADRIKALFEKAKPYELTLEDGEQMEIDLEKNDSSDEVFDTMENYLDNILPADIKDFSTYKGRKTGFNNLDNVIGSLYPGFYVVGALSSLGKTTFCHQLADQMAERGEHILYFSLEQSRLEMVTKSLSRTMAKKNMDKAFSSLQIRTGKTSQELQEAIQKYKNVVGNNMNIVQGNLETNIKTVETLTESYIIRKQVKPIVFIDYLQILQGDPTKDFSMLKQCVDDNVKRLKQLSEKFHITVIAISSVNRQNYLSVMDFESFKESGNIEFTADVVWGLQLQAIHEDLFSQKDKLNEKRERIQRAKAESPRKIELICLKNRYGISSYNALFDYYSRVDLFVESDGFEPDKQNEGQSVFKGASGRKVLPPL